MLTSLDFGTNPPLRNLPTMDWTRGPTLSEFALGTNASLTNCEMDLWTAARMSASFPYVSPAARMRLTGSQGTTNVLASYHLVDGGYYDNYAVGAVLDWLEPVLRARLNLDTNLTFSNVAILQLRAFSESNHSTNMNGGLAALFGPPIALSHVFGTSARERNNIAITDFIYLWNQIFRSANNPSLTNVQLKTFVFERADASGPLSWQLTPLQISRVTNEWTTNANLTKTLRELDRFLAFKSGSADP
jgi:hypothetical protein